MREISLDAPTQRLWFRDDKGSRFLVLGAAEVDALSTSARDRILRRNAAQQPDVWGTLGPWDDRSPKGWKGVLRISNRGTEWSRVEDSGTETTELISDIERGTTLADGARIRERFIDLTDLRFDALENAFVSTNPPAIRLTLFVRPDEGALVYVQHGPAGEDGADFITPESTGDDHNCSSRDRLHYRIPVASPGKILSVQPEEKDELRIKTEKRARFAPDAVLKILTFQRKNSSSYDVLKNALEKLGRKRGALSRWNVRSGRFEPTEPSAVKRDRKTLLLLHGTFSSTSGSFSELADGSTWSWLQTVSIAQQRYQQVLAFDHDTVLESLPQNAALLRELTGGSFSIPLDILAHSRGGLLAKHLAIYEPGFEVERAFLSGCANGVGYMSALRHIALMLSVLRRFLRFTVGGAIVAALAQHSVEAIASLPGLSVMTPESEGLLRVLKTPIPQGRTPMKALPLVGDYDKALVDSDRWIKRAAINGLDLLIKAILGAQHDWVVGTKNQAILAPGCLAQGASRTPIKAFHTNYYGSEANRERARRFLVQGLAG